MFWNKSVCALRTQVTPVLTILQQNYFKATAYRVKPEEGSRSGYITVDGEAFPYEEFQVEVHKNLGTLMSPYGHYAADFQERPKTRVGKGSRKCSIYNYFAWLVHWDL